MEIFLLSAFIWFAIGVASFTYWWTKKHDLTTDDIGIMLFCGSIGPFSWLIGWSVLGEPSSKILIRKRNP